MTWLERAAIHPLLPASASFVIRSLTRVVYLSGFMNLHWHIISIPNPQFTLGLTCFRLHYGLWQLHSDICIQFQCHTKDLVLKFICVLSTCSSLLQFMTKTNHIAVSIVSLLQNVMHLRVKQFVVFSKWLFSLNKRL